MEILSFLIKHSTMEISFLNLFLAPLCPLFCRFKNCGNCGLVAKLASLSKLFASKGGSLRFDLWKHGIVEIVSFLIKHSTVEISFLCLFLASLSPPFFVDSKIVESAD